jgi:uncharacterized membrane protein YadS
MNKTLSHVAMKALSTPWIPTAAGLVLVYVLLIVLGVSPQDALIAGFGSSGAGGS